MDNKFKKGWFKVFNFFSDPRYYLVVGGVLGGLGLNFYLKNIYASAILYLVASCFFIRSGWVRSIRKIEVNKKWQ